MSDVPATTDDTELQLTEQDAAFVLERKAGTPSIDAVAIAFKDDKEIKEAIRLRESSDPKDREQGKLILRRKAANLNRQHKIQVLTSKLTERMQRMGDVALDTLEELMIEGKSEKVRADIAIEVSRQNLGNPDKSETGQQNVIIMIGKDPSQQIMTTATEEVIDV